MGKVKTGSSSDYTAADEAELEAAAADAWDDYYGYDASDEAEDWSDDDPDGDALPDAITITADIEWAGSYNPRPHRTTRLVGLDLSGMHVALKARRQAAAALDRAEKRAGRMKAKGWHAQLRELTRTKAGYAAADGAGLNVSRRTLTRWLAETQAPSKANQDRIAAAYRELARGPVERARSTAAARSSAVADALTRAVKRTYGADVRFFNISDLEIG